MRNLKKALALILAMMMTLSLVVVVNAADYGDADKIEHTEAVEVMSAIGVLTGDDLGNFNPDATLTREQAAKIITYMAMNPSTAERLGTTSDPFADVAAGRWSAGAISYCVGRNIVVGVGDNKFDPAGTLTGYQFAAMLLRTVTDGAYNNAASWTLDVATTFYGSSLLSAELDDIDLAAPLSRQDAAQMAFNALQYTTGGETVYIVKDPDGNEIQCEDQISALLYAQNDGYTYMGTKDIPTGSLANSVFGLSYTSTEDEFCRTTKTWYTGEDPIVVLEVAPKATFTGPVTKGALARALGAKTNADRYTYTVYLNGVKGETSEPFNRTNTASADRIKESGNGTLIEAYPTTTKNHYNLVVINTYVDKLADRNEVFAAKEATNTTDAQPAYILLDNPYYNAEDEDSEKTLPFETAAFKGGDVVLYTVSQKNGEAVVNAAHADYFSGTVSATGSGYFRVDGDSAQYKTSAKISEKDATICSTPSTQPYTFYKDFYGNVIFTAQGVTATVEQNYVYVAEVVARPQGDDNSNLFENVSGTPAAAQARIIDLSTGAVSIVNRAIVLKDRQYYYANPNGSASDLPVTEIKVNSEASKAAAGVYLYNVLEDGSYVLSGPVKGESDVTIQKGNAALKTGLYANSTTALTVVAYTNDKNGNLVSAKVTNYTGVNNFPTLNSGKPFDGVVVNANGSVVSSMIVVGAAAVETTDTYAVYAGVGETDRVGTKGTFVVNGEAVQYYVDKELDLKSGDVYKITVENNTVKTAELQTAKCTGDVRITDASYVVVHPETGNDQLVYLASDCLVLSKSEGYAAGTIALDDTVTIYTKTVNGSEVAYLIIIA